MGERSTYQSLDGLVEAKVGKITIKNGAILFGKIVYNEDRSFTDTGMTLETNGVIFIGNTK